MTRRLVVVLDCADTLAPRVRWALESLLMAANIPVEYASQAPAQGPWLHCAEHPGVAGEASGRGLYMPHSPLAWQSFDAIASLRGIEYIDGLPVVLPQGARPPRAADGRIAVDLLANAFYFLSSWAERRGSSQPGSRRLHASSEFARLGVPQDIVDRYLAHLRGRIDALCDRLGVARWPALTWPGGAHFAIVLSHDVDYLPVGPLDNALQAAKTVGRHLVRQRQPMDALRSALGYGRALLGRHEPYGVIEPIIARERSLAVRSSFTVAVGHRHANDVKYRIEEAAVRAQLQPIVDAGFDLCLHGSYLSTQDPQWYVDEVELLAGQLGRPVGSRQHYLSFDYDNLFVAQERSGIRYDMSLGFPDRPGPRNGFSFPFFPYHLREERPFRVLQIGLFLMDVTFSGYLRLSARSAQAVVDECLAGLHERRGASSAVWHPIVFGGARDPGYDALYWHLASETRRRGGLATDGRTIDAHWRELARHFPSLH